MLIVDTNVLFASMDRSDAHHAVCSDLLDHTQELIIVPAPVLPELDHFVRTRLGYKQHLALLKEVIEGRLSVMEMRFDDYVRVHEICEKYADADIGLVDASIVALAERLKEPKIATLDHRHFSIIKPHHVDSLELLPRLTRSRPRRKLK